MRAWGGGRQHRQPERPGEEEEKWACTGGEELYRKIECHPTTSTSAGGGRVSAKSEKRQPMGRSRVQGAGEGRLPS